MSKLTLCCSCELNLSLLTNSAFSIQPCGQYLGTIVQCKFSALDSPLGPIPPIRNTNVEKNLFLKPKEWDLVLRLLSVKTQD